MKALLSTDPSMNSSNNIAEISPIRAPRGVVIAKVLSVDADGRVFLRMSLRGKEHMAASCCLCKPADLNEGMRVAVVFQELNTDLAVVIGPVVAECDGACTSSPQVRPRTLSLEAAEKVVLKSGKSSVVLNADGSILLKGEYLVSKSNGINSIKGASVRIN